ncbi:MAG: hypothetical protein Fur002_16960 [Anaerolineales bacterium]
MKKEFSLALFLFAVLLAVVLLAAKQFAPAAPMAADAACPVLMSEIIVSAQGSVYNMEGVESAEPEFYYLVYYSAQGDAISTPVYESVPAAAQDEQQDSAAQQEAWRLFTDIIPTQNRQMIGQYAVFTDGYSNTLAAVEQDPKDITRWILGIDLADLEDKDALLFTLVHEYAHLLTLNAEQVVPDQALVNDWNNPKLLKEKAALCSNYFTGTGCSYPNSYIQTFYDRFWAGDVNNEWQAIDALQYEEDLNPYYEGLYQFYLSHSDEFVDDYSVTHPAEDIAESFAYFIFAPKPSGNSVKEQKIAFFYDYPELVTLRENILASVCAINP